METMKLVSAVSFLLLAPAGAAINCQDAKEYSGTLEGENVNMCYYPRGTISFQKAKDKCQNLGMQLVMPKTMKQALIMRGVCAVVDDADGGYDCTWINLECHGSSSECDTSFDHWNYGDGTPLQSDAMGLMKFAEDGTLVGGGYNELCAHYWGVNEPSEWGPQPCGDHWYGALCEPVSGGGGGGPTSYGDPHFKTWSGE